MLMQFLMGQALKYQRKRMQVDANYDVEAYLNKIVKYFDPAKASDRRLVVVYEFHDSGKNDGAWTISIADGKCQLTKGDTQEFDTKLYMTAEAYRLMLSGKVDYARLAYSTGAVRYFGNTLGHRELNWYLAIPKADRVACL